MLEYRENDKLRHPHAILITVHASNGHEDSILIGELMLLIAAIRCRANQPKLMKDEDEEELFETLENDPAEHLSRDPLFAKETRSPVLMVSLLGPQNGRLFFACMDGDRGRLVIRQSRLFSFENEATAPWDFFSCWLLSNPLTESESALVCIRTRT